MWYYIGILFLLLLGVIMCDELNDRFKRIPFGPIRIPIIGNLHHLYFYDRKYVYKALTKLARKHGETMKFWFGFVGSVVISGYDRISHVLRSDEWVGEPDPVWVLGRAASKGKGKRSTATENADAIQTWATARMYATHVLRDYSFDKASLDNLLSKKSAELCELLEYWRSENGGIVDMNNFFLPFSLSLNWALITGENLSVMENPRIEKLIGLVKQWEALTIQTSKYIDNWPMLSETASTFTRYDELLGVNEKIKEFLKNLIEEYKSKGDYLKATKKNMVESCLMKIEECKNAATGKSLSSAVEFSEDMLISVLFNLLFPSSLVLQSTLCFAVLNLARHANVQEKLTNEVKGVAGKLNRMLTSDDMERMTYLKAFVHELYRTSNVIPFEKRKMLKTVREGDTRVTRGMILVINYDSVNGDDKIWPDPSTFQPERFVDGSGGILNEDKNLAVIAAKRLCVGELVARSTIMHVLCSISQKFRFSLTNKSKHALEPEWGLINKPMPYEVSLERLT